ncbi:MAG: hypothetical protein WBP22_05600 [Candidatus Saccharimonas sp.]
MNMTILLICLSVTIIVMIAVEACRNMKGVVSILGMYLPVPAAPDESNVYDPDEYDFGLENDEPAPPATSLEISHKVRRKFFDLGSKTRPQPNEDDAEFMKHVESRMPRPSSGN